MEAPAFPFCIWKWVLWNSLIACTQLKGAVQSPSSFFSKPSHPVFGLTDKHVLCWLIALPVSYPVSSDRLAVSTWSLRSPGLDAGVKHSNIQQPKWGWGTSEGESGGLCTLKRTVQLSKRAVKFAAKRDSCRTGIDGLTNMTSVPENMTASVSWYQRQQEGKSKTDDLKGNPRNSYLSVAGLLLFTMK